MLLRLHGVAQNWRRNFVTRCFVRDPALGLCHKASVVTAVLRKTERLSLGERFATFRRNVVSSSSRVEHESTTVLRNVGSHPRIPEPYPQLDSPPPPDYGSSEASRLGL